MTKASSIIKKYTMTIALVVVFIFFTVLTNGRLVYAQNISNLLLQNAYVLVMACGMLLCILTGGNVDLSVGATLCLVGAVAAQLMDQNSMGALPTILIAMLIAAVIGIWQGFWIGYIHIPPFIATLAGMFLFRGLGRVVLASKTVNIQNEAFLNTFISYIDVPGMDTKSFHVSALIVGVAVAVLLTVLMLSGRAKKVKKNYAADSLVTTLVKVIIIDALIIAYCWKLANYKGIPVMLLWILLVVLIFAFITMKTAFGRYFYAVGGNEKAAKLSGIDPRRVYFWAYFLMSVLAGFSGLLVAARIGSVDGNMGNSYEMDAIAACFIGGASAYGGSGTVSGIMIGAILLGVMNQGMSIYGLPDEWQYVVKGAVLLAAVIFDVVSNHKVGKQ
ncbi:Xylose transport system permease protein XylH [Caprobacter fermentans]|uniref:Xylose transport system permease protein XylH n=1 Tax=Caproicibacter fermentans TaxID=2576756 RepID=A0A6N8HV16_9FIRM|nr:sugar ABC transporter permease [Caproicibacter fermentans]MVB09380.1 Xylose transport system permease protein XylH [Caproicibacter fermentans]OCN02783.1 ABC transporter permease [Clostridium sp. W14A]